MCAANVCRVAAKVIEALRFENLLMRESCTICTTPLCSAVLVLPSSRSETRRASCRLTERLLLAQEFA